MVSFRQQGLAIETRLQRWRDYEDKATHFICTHLGTLIEQMDEKGLGFRVFESNLHHEH